MLIFAWNVPLVSLVFLKRYLVLPILLFSSISLHWSLRKAFLSLLAVLWSSAFKWEYLSFSPLLFASLLFTVICKASSDSHFAFLHCVVCVSMYGMCDVCVFGRGRGHALLWSSGKWPAHLSKWGARFPPSVTLDGMLPWLYRQVGLTPSLSVSHLPVP